MSKLQVIWFQVSNWQVLRFWTRFYTFSGYFFSHWEIALKVRWMDSLLTWKNNPEGLHISRRCSLMTLRVSLHKMPKFDLISWCGNLVESHSFRKILGNSPETLQRMCVSTSSLLQLFFLDWLSHFWPVFPL